MPRFFFDVFNGKEVVRDEEGQSFASLDAAEVDADDAARKLAAALVIGHRPMGSRELLVRDAEGGIVWVVPFKDVVA